VETADKYLSYLRSGTDAHINTRVQQRAVREAYSNTTRNNTDEEPHRAEQPVNSYDQTFFASITEYKAD